MSQENVEIVRRYVEAFNRADVEACLDLSHPETEADVSRATGPLRWHLSPCRSRTEPLGKLP
jgi:ketosteroid isomerase-like protein